MSPGNPLDVAAAETNEMFGRDVAGTSSLQSCTIHGRSSRPSEPELSKLATLGLATLGIAHDLGNHLTVLGAAINVICRSLSKAQASEMLPMTEAALTALDRAATMSRSILDLTCAPKQQEIVSLGALVVAGVERIALIAGPKVGVEVALCADVPAVRCNPRDLEDAILNLISNARDAMPDGGTLTLCLSHATSVRARTPIEEIGTSYVVLRITDTGCGIPSDLREKVFEPLFSTKPLGRGTGLGLAMVSDFVNRLGGHVELHSVVGEGTSIALWLPAYGQPQC